MEDQSNENEEQEAIETTNNQPVNNQQAPPQQENENPGYFSVLRGFMIRALIIYFIASYFRGTPQQATNSSTTTGSSAAPKTPATNMMFDGSSLDLYVYVNEKEEFKFLSEPVWIKKDLIYGNWDSGPNSDGVFSHSLSFEPSDNLKNNGSIYIHGYLVKSGFSPNPKEKGRYHRPSTMYVSQKLNKFYKIKYQKTSNLITGKTELSLEEIQKAESMKEEITSHWHPNITINLVHDFTNWVKGAVPPPLDEFLEFTPAGDQYKPIVFLNTYWNLYREYAAINETTTSLNLTITLQPLTLFKWQMYAAQTMKSKWSFMDGLNAGDDEENQDALKEMFLETSPYLLALTGIVSLLHSIFEMLAFKNDVQFWNNRKSLEGLSVRSVFFNVFQSLIVLLYVMDNETNFVIKMSCFVGLFIELWKITKVMDVSINYEKRILGIPTLSFKDRGTYVESQTKRFDEMAFKYLGMLFFPLLGCYVVYSLIYHEHKGWYSFALSMLYGFLLTFGFIMMTPQLFINYKMKSVAHLPWRMLTYKALNTFIDDIFAFVIKMPTMYRIGCFRDDIVFFIFLYQRYVYPIDPSRVNEFGFSQEQEINAKEGAGKAITQMNSDESSKPKALEDKKRD